MQRDYLKHKRRMEKKAREKARQARELQRAKVGLQLGPAPDLATLLKDHCSSKPVSAADRFGQAMGLVTKKIIAEKVRCTAQ